MMNYQEAAIYLEEGVNNEKFDTHPKSHKALPAYLIGKKIFLETPKVILLTYLAFCCFISS